MVFAIQVGNPRVNMKVDDEDTKISEAIESIFLLDTEDLIMIWNNIRIPLSYKYDVSYMIDDILLMLKMLSSEEVGNLSIQWLPDVFRCNWNINWNKDEISIEAQWENIIGHLEELLNKYNRISMNTDDFIYEWKALLSILCNRLTQCGYKETALIDMNKLVEQYNNIKDVGIMYKN